MRINNVNNQPAFGMVYATIKNNGRTGFATECKNLSYKLCREKGKQVISARSNPIIGEAKGDFLFVIQCCKKRNPISVNYKGETDLINRLQKWTHRKGFGKVKFERE